MGRSLDADRRAEKAGQPGHGPAGTRTEPAPALGTDAHHTLAENVSTAENEVLRAFERWSQESRISISSIKPQWKRGGDDDYVTLECRADAFGNISAVTRFLYEVEKDPLALKVESVEISARDSGGQQLELGLVVSGLQLNSELDEGMLH